MRASFPSWADSRLPRRAERANASRAERLLCALGADPDFVQAVLGDLAEERATRSAVDGARSASWWYVREALRSAPHLVASAVRGASWRRRAMLMMGLVTVVFAVTFAAWTVSRGSGAPAQLVANGDTGDGIVVNNLQPVQLGMRVLDSSGRVLPDAAVRYCWLSGAPIPVTSHGVATCTQRGDVVVGASVGRLSTQFVLRCRPVHKVNALRTVNLVVGDSAAGVPFVAFDAQGRIVSLLRGELSVEDSSVATLDVAADGTRRVRARAPGTTMLRIHIGDRLAGTGVHVYERASSPEGIRPGQHLAMRVELGVGDVRQWHLPAGREVYSVSMLPDGDYYIHVPRVAIVGANCESVGDAHSFWCVALHGASIFVYHSRDDDQARTVRGTLAIWRRAKP